jgi:hypothetical protein
LEDGGMRFKQKLTQMLSFTGSDQSTHIVKKIKYLINNPVKKIALAAILIFAFFSLGGCPRIEKVGYQFISCPGN